MKKSLLEQLPQIVAEGKRRAEQILGGLYGRYKVRLQTNAADLRRQPAHLQALLAGDQENGIPSLRGKIDLIYIDQPFDSKADYRTKVILPSPNGRGSTRSLG